MVYVDLRRPSEQSSRPPPEEYHWPPRASGAIPSSLQYTPEAVMVSAQVFIVSSPHKARGLEADGKLLFCVFGAGTKVWPDGTVVEPHGDGCGGYIQDLTWLLIGWLQGKNLSELPDYYDPDAKAIVYCDRTTGEYQPCTHLPNFVTFYAAFHRIEQDSVTGELGVKVAAAQKYAAMKRGIAKAALPST